MNKTLLPLAKDLRYLIHIEMSKHLILQREIQGTINTVKTKQN